MPPGSAQTATNSKFLGSFYQASPGQSQAATDFSLHGSPSQGAPEKNIHEAGVKSQ